jgi:hypothetical protein
MIIFLKCIIFAAKRKYITINSGFFFPFPVPTDQILCSMKLSAMLSRQKGRDFYDAMFLLGQTTPDYSFLAKKHNIHNL